MKAPNGVRVRTTYLYLSRMLSLCSHCVSLSSLIGDIRQHAMISGFGAETKNTESTNGIRSHMCYLYLKNASPQRGKREHGWFRGLKCKHDGSPRWHSSPNMLLISKECFPQRGTRSHDWLQELEQTAWAPQMEFEPNRCTSL